MPIGKIISLENNYGIISTNSFKFKDERIPFEIEKRMLEKKNGKEYIKYTIDVEFTLKNSQGIRDRDIKEADNVQFVGEKWEYQERNIPITFQEIVKRRLDEYNFYYPKLEGKEFDRWLDKNDFQPRMLEYLVPGIFIPKEILKIRLKNIDSKFNVKLLFVIDRIDIQFRKNILSWITNIENGYKAYFSKLEAEKNGKNIGEEIVFAWENSKPKMKKLIRRARNKRKYRIFSNEFDYIFNENSVPLMDLLEQIELNELSEVISLFYTRYDELGEVPMILKKMKGCIGFIGDLCAIRNAAAHGRSILPAFMDPDYNGNWDLEFDNIEIRGNVESWILTEPLKRGLNEKGLQKHLAQIVNTIYGNPIRRAWAELNYIYFFIIEQIEPRNFKIFIKEVKRFFYKDKKDINLLDLHLLDMGDTTLGVSTEPYNEIIQETFAIWELF